LAGDVVQAFFEIPGGGFRPGFAKGKSGPPPGVSPKEAWHGFSDGVQKLNTKMLIVEKKT